MRLETVVLKMIVFSAALQFLAAMSLAVEVPGWHTIQDGWEQACAQQKPLLVYISFPGCHYCRRMEQQTWTNKQLQTLLSESFLVARIDGEQEAEWPNRWGVRIFPTILVISPENKVLLTVTGYITAEQLTDKLSTYQNRSVATTSVNPTR